eukprot:4533558-Prymnesium_polylepis.1
MMLLRLRPRGPRCGVRPLVDGAGRCGSGLGTRVDRKWIGDRTADHGGHQDLYGVLGATVRSRCPVDSQCVLRLAQTWSSPR